MYVTCVCACMHKECESTYGMYMCVMCVCMCVMCMCMCVMCICMNTKLSLTSSTAEDNDTAIALFHSVCCVCACV